MATHYRTAEYEETIQPSLLERRLPKHGQRTVGRRGHSEAGKPLFITQTRDLRKASVLTDVTWESNSEVFKSSDEEDDEHSDKPTRLGVGEVMKVLYEKECKRLGVCPVGAFLRAPGKSCLALRNYSIGPKGAAALAVPLLLDSCVTAIDLEGNSIEACGLASLAGVLLESNYITHANLANNKLGRQGAEIIKQLLLSNFYITHINISENKFTDMDAETFAQIIRENKHLKELLLSKNEFGEYGGKIFGPAIASNDNLELLDLSWNQIRGRGAIAIAQALKENVGLKTLNLSFNGFGAEGASAVGGALANNRTLRELDLSHNRIVDSAIKDVASGLASNDDLVTLKIGDNALTQPSALALLEAVKRNESGALASLDLENISVTEEFLTTLEEIRAVKPFKVVYGLKSKIRITKPEPVLRRESEYEESDDTSDIGDDEDNLDGINDEQEKPETVLPEADGKKGTDGDHISDDATVVDGDESNVRGDEHSDENSARQDINSKENEESGVIKEEIGREEEDESYDDDEGQCDSGSRKESDAENVDQSVTPTDGGKGDLDRDKTPVNPRLLETRASDRAPSVDETENKPDFEDVTTVMADDDDDDGGNKPADDDDDDDDGGNEPADDDDDGGNEPADDDDPVSGGVDNSSKSDHVEDTGDVPDNRSDIEKS